MMRSRNGSFLLITVIFLLVSGVLLLPVYPGFSSVGIANNLIPQDGGFLTMPWGSVFFIQLIILMVLSVLLTALYLNISNLNMRLDEQVQEKKQLEKRWRQEKDKLMAELSAGVVKLSQSNTSLEDEITIRKKTAEKLEEQKKIFSILVDAIGHPLYIIDANTYQVVFANKAACNMTGVSRFFGKTCYEISENISVPCDMDGFPCSLVEVKKTKKPSILEHCHRSDNGADHYSEIHAYPILDADGNVSHMIEYSIDVTDLNVVSAEKQRLQNQLLAAQKMEAVGMLAGGVAHDFNNILTTILGYSQIMAMKLPEEHSMREMVEEIHSAAEKGSGLTHQLLAFSRKQVMEMRVVSLNTIVEDIITLLKRIIGEDIGLSVDLDASAGNVKVDTGQIEQVIMNLAVNARDAMPKGGQLTIKTGQTEFDEKYKAVHPEVEPGRYNVLSVTDTGKGMSLQEQEKIFEPFFTTKKRGKGTGLGLSTVYGIIRQHKGGIYVYSEEGKGTTFKIYIPSESTEALEVNVKENHIMLPGTETIMIVDDDDSIRRLVIDTLEPLGYSLCEAGSAEDALKVMEKNGRKIDLVLTDLIMTGMNGQEMIEVMQATRPEQKCILMSGYTDDIITRQGGLKPGVEFINKPLLPVSLANKVREVLDS